MSPAFALKSPMMEIPYSCRAIAPIAANSTASSSQIRKPKPSPHSFTNSSKPSHRGRGMSSCPPIPLHLSCWLSAYTFCHGCMRSLACILTNKCCRVHHSPDGPYNSWSQYLLRVGRSTACQLHAISLRLSYKIIERSPRFRMSITFTLASILKDSNYSLVRYHGFGDRCLGIPEYSRKTENRTSSALLGRAKSSLSPRKLFASYTRKVDL